MPGRVCLLGEHSDWAGHYRRFNSAIEKGRCIVSGTNQGIHARVYPHPTHLVLRCTVDTGEVYEDSIPPRRRNHIGWCPLCTSHHSFNSPLENCQGPEKCHPWY